MARTTKTNKKRSVKINKPYIDDTNTRYTKLAHFANRTNHKKHGDKYCVLWMIDKVKLDNNDPDWVCRSHILNYIGITANGNVLNDRESITNYLSNQQTPDQEVTDQLANFSCVRVIGGTITQICLDKANELLQKTGDQCMICWDGDPVKEDYHFTSVLVTPTLKSRPKQAFVLPNNIDPYPHHEDYKSELMKKTMYNSL